MAKLPSTVESNNTAVYPIAYAEQIGGHKTVRNSEELRSISDVILSKSGNNSNGDAIGQEWYVVSEKRRYRLISWENRKTAEGWERVDSRSINVVDKTGTSDTDVMSQNAVTREIQELIRKFEQLESEIHPSVQPITDAVMLHNGAYLMTHDNKYFKTHKI